MNKKEVCTNNKAFAYYSGFGGLEFNNIEYGVNDYIYCTSGAWTGKPAYHRLKIYYTVSGQPYIKLHGYRVLLDECIRINVA